MTPARRTACLLAAVGLLAVCVVASVALGARVVAWGDVVAALTGGGQGLDAAAVQQRVPRTVLALLVGAALGLTGTALQGITRNPLADPGILGISPGAALAVVVGLAFFDLRSPMAYLWVAVAGAAVAAVVVYGIGSLGRGGPTPLKLALAGAVTWATTSALSSAILLPRIDVMTVFRFWQIGGVGGAQPSTTLVALPLLVVGALVCLASARGLNSLALGDDVAAGLGAHVGRTRLVAGGAAVLLCGAATALAGPIGFLGLVVPHLGRLLVGTDHRWLLPFSAVLGATLLTAADVAGRVVARPDEIDVGIVTALLGAPVFIAIVRRRRVAAL